VSESNVHANCTVRYWQLMTSDGTPIYIGM
jgi:hypothetical protein